MPAADTQPKIRVLVVDDSAVVRRIVTDVLAEDPAFAIPVTAPNGAIALQKLTASPVDLVTLDVEMPELDGISTLAAIRKTHPKLPVIMFSSQTQRAAAATIEALTRGASDYVGKPEGASVAIVRARIRDELIPKIKALCGRPTTTAKTITLPIALPVAATPKTVPIRIAMLKPKAKATATIRVVAIGVSTGGPPVLQEIVSRIPVGFPAPILIVQHMPATFTSMLAHRLAQASALPVEEAVSGTPIAPGRIWLAPGDQHLVVERVGTTIQLRTHQGPPESSCRPAVDALFRSVAEVYGPSALGVVLTGMGQDGLRGTELLHARGANVIVQDAATSVVWGMPGAIARAGLADRVLPVPEIAGEIVRRVAA
jgi:two-component system, chemotaxis family, protein-glutamate methylesterase/glutaminase